MSSRLVVKLEIDGGTHRHIRSWLPDGDAGFRLFDFFIRLLNAIHELEDVQWREADDE